MSPVLGGMNHSQNMFLKLPVLSSVCFSSLSKDSPKHTYWETKPSSIIPFPNWKSNPIHSTIPAPIPERHCAFLPCEFASRFLSSDQSAAWHILHRRNTCWAVSAILALARAGSMASSKVMGLLKMGKNSIYAQLTAAGNIAGNAAHQGQDRFSIALGSLSNSRRGLSHGGLPVHPSFPSDHHTSAWRMAASNPVSSKII